MDGNIQYAAQYLQGGTRFIIPVYQRNYDWSIANCRRLWNDLISAKTENLPTHFFGSIVVKPAKLAQETIIIDGQQRLTTVSLLILAIANWLDEHHADSVKYSGQSLKEVFLLRPFATDNTPEKLVPIKRDRKAYYALYSSPQNYIQGSNITNNYQYFFDQLEEQNISTDDLVDSIQKLQLMVVNLGENDDAQLIFESLNSTGLALTDADKIRNFLLMRENSVDQEKIFEEYWEPIENLTGSSAMNNDVTSFFRDFLTIQNSKTPNNNAIYDTFKDYFSHQVTDKWEFFENLLQYANSFQQINCSSTDQQEANKILFRLNYLNTTVQRPFLIAIHVAYLNKKISAENFVAVLKVTENFIARRMIAEVPSNALNKIFATLYRDSMKYYKESETNLAAILIFLLQSRSGAGRYPDDSEISESLKKRDMYHINIKFRTYLFERLENGDTHEPINVYNGIDEHRYSVEHIMPQTLSTEWKSDLGGAWESIHEQWLHNLGNLTLTGYNSEYSNRRFIEKKSMDGGFTTSHFVNLNELPRRAEKWDQDEIENRLDQLVNLALVRWPELTTDFHPKTDTANMEPFDGENHFRGYKLLGYSFMNDAFISEKIWKNMYLHVVKRLFEIDSTIIVELKDSSDTFGIGAQFSGSEKIGNKKFTLVAPGIYVNADTDNWNKMQAIKNLFDLYRIPYDELSLKVVNQG